METLGLAVPRSGIVASGGEVEVVRALMLSERAGTW